jgi:hypothetical protein
VICVFSGVSEIIKGTCGCLIMVIELGERTTNYESYQETLMTSRESNGISAETIRGGTNTTTRLDRLL